LPEIFAVKTLCKKAPRPQSYQSLFETAGLPAHLEHLVYVAAKGIHTSAQLQLVYLVKWFDHIFIKIQVTREVPIQAVGREHFLRRSLPPDFSPDERAGFPFSFHSNPFLIHFPTPDLSPGSNIAGMGGGEKKTFKRQTRPESFRLRKRHLKGWRRKRHGFLSQVQGP